MELKSDGLPIEFGTLCARCQQIICANQGWTILVRANDTIDPIHDACAAHPENWSLTFPEDHEC
jgi:hypothetical protein